MVRARDTAVEAQCRAHTRPLPPPALPPRLAEGPLTLADASAAVDACHALFKSHLKQWSVAGLQTNTRLLLRGVFDEGGTWAREQRLRREVGLGAIRRPAGQPVPRPPEQRLYTWHKGLRAAAAEVLAAWARGPFIRFLLGVGAGGGEGEGEGGTGQQGGADGRQAPPTARSRVSVDGRGVEAEAWVEAGGASRAAEDLGRAQAAIADGVATGRATVGTAHSADVPPSRERPGPRSGDAELGQLAAGSDRGAPRSVPLSGRAPVAVVPPPVTAAALVLQRAARVWRARRAVQWLTAERFTAVLDEGSGHYYYYDQVTGETAWEAPLFWRKRL